MIAVVALAFSFWFGPSRVQMPKTFRSWVQIGLVGVAGFGLLYPLQLMGLRFISSGLSASIMLTSPLLLVGLERQFLRTPIGWQKVVALILGIVGGVILISPNGSMKSSNAILGSVLTLAASLALAASVIFTRNASKDLDVRSLTFWSMVIGFVVMLPFGLQERQPQLSELSMAPVLSLFYLGLICSVVCFLIWNKAIGISRPQEIASTMHVKTPVAILIGTLVGSELLSTRPIIGAAIVTFGVWLSQYQSRRKGGQNGS